MSHNPTEKSIRERPPVIAIMGHIDHGKSTLLDYIRKTTIADLEAGGITQQISAYEVTHKNKAGEEKIITFLDTPGHEAFSTIRERGAEVADIAVLVISAEDGVKPQTLEAYKTIQKAGLPYIVAINKIDKPGANVDRVKNNLLEHEIYLEGYGGDVPYVPISAKTGEGVPELLDMMLLVAELQDLKGDASKKPEGVVIETKLDKKRGVSAGLLIKDGTLRKGMQIVAGTSISAARIFENFLGKAIDEASFSSPINVIGWSDMPQVGSSFITFDNKRDAEKYADEFRQKQTAARLQNKTEEDQPDKVIVPLIIKANVSGVLEAIEHEIAKFPSEKVALRIISKSIGDVSENDVKIASGKADTVILGFNTPIDSKAKSYAERLGITIECFDVIYKLTEWLQKIVEEKTPKVQVEQTTGVAKILKVFSVNRDKQVIGGRVESGVVKVGENIKIMRREAEIGRGKIRELQQQKSRVSDVEEGREFGTLIEAKIEITPGDKIECIELVTK